MDRWWHSDPAGITDEDQYGQLRLLSPPPCLSRLLSYRAADMDTVASAVVRLLGYSEAFDI